jgi:PAS domain S-box-containing protein
MAYNTALSVAMLGLGLVALSFGRRAPARLAAAVVALMAVMRLFQYVTGFPPGFETIVSRYTLPHPPIAAVPIAPNTAIGLLLIAGAVWLGAGRLSRRASVAMGTCASAAAALGIDAFVGYLAGLPTYVWLGFTPMALHTAAALILLGAAVLLGSWRMSPAVRKDCRLWISAVVGTAGVVTAISFWEALALLEHLHSASVARFRSGLPEAVLIFGVLVTGALVAALYFAQSARLRTGLAEGLRTQAERAFSALAESERTYRTLIENLPQKIAYKNRDSVYISCNENYARDLNITPSAIAGKTDDDFFPRELAEKYRADDRHVMDSGQLAEIEEEYFCHEQKRWVQTVKTPVRDARGAVTGVIVFFEDITERRQAQQELVRTSEALSAERQRFANVLDLLPAYVVLLSPDYHVPFANRFFRERFGEAHGRRCYEYLFGRNEPCEVCDTYKVLKTGAPQRWEWTGPDGHNYDIYDFPFTDVDGSHLILEMGIDITERKQAETRLRQQAALLDLAHDAIFVRDLESRIRFWNQGASEMYGWSGREVEGLISHELLRTQFPVPLEQIEAAVREHGKWEGEIKQVTRDGKALTVESRWSLQLAENGAPLAILEITRDITGRKQAEEALEQKARDLARSNADLEQFAYVASHDLQEPLRMVANFTQLLADRYRDKVGEEGAEFITFAVDGATRMQRLIQDLLTYSRVGSRGRSFQPTDCNEVLGAAVANLQVAIQENAAVITHEELPTILADATQMTQVIQNLVGNAIKFHGEAPPRVHVSAARQGNTWVFSVRDNGIGIDSAFSDRIFVIFQRLHARGQYPGTGIGLALCKKIVERHGGTIRVESKPGQGATFLFTIPVTVGGLHA